MTLLPSTIPAWVIALFWGAPTFVVMLIMMIVAGERGMSVFAAALLAPLAVLVFWCVALALLAGVAAGLSFLGIRINWSDWG